MSDSPDVFAAFLAVKADVEKIGKNQQVQSGPARFKFRGVDDVMNALHGPMSKHGLICVPQVQERLDETRSTSSGGSMNVVHVRVRFAFYGHDGSTFHAEAWGEGQDSGDKATGKAHSMAYKSALLQAFHIPTEDTPDADRDSTPASRPARPPRSPVQQAKARLWQVALGQGLTVEQLAAGFEEWASGEKLADASVEVVDEYTAHLTAGSAS
jgi:hypothetical protein